MTRKKRKKTSKKSWYSYTAKNAKGEYVIQGIRHGLEAARKRKREILREYPTVTKVILRKMRKG